MTRAITIALCFIAALFLVPVQGECLDISESEPETEVVICDVVASIYKSDFKEELSESYSYSGQARHRETALAGTRKQIIRLPARILNCVFRE